MTTQVRHEEGIGTRGRAHSMHTNVRRAAQLVDWREACGGDGVSDLEGRGAEDLNSGVALVGHEQPLATGGSPETQIPHGFSNSPSPAPLDPMVWTCSPDAAVNTCTR